MWSLLAIVVVAFAVWGWKHARSDTAFFAASRTAGALLAGAAVGSLAMVLLSARSDSNRDPEDNGETSH
jgi:hypothetical protein